ncbi:monovalent cation/H(+) antiporter subunit G [Aliidiomarina halalkaliphila]|uniref:Monovalent cation/H(+) antiporter subunit G n=1 Tax=Aliidiomarina halalkaliphila TaxID=2593535 RepID=A0A552X5F8_9GAMM|nr:monovalent cation/H(+) antiporter subunit G [Aliidiomarina halalkaliphila]TRW50238.1 monovalent cation/H(+) antiporter subunit G [Aliidiomarina halalkaliphila]
MMYLQILIISVGALFFLVGTVGLLRFPDVYTRIHALTKADNIGMGLIVLGLLPSTDSVAQALKLILCWLLVLGASSVAAYLVAAKQRASEAKERAADAKTQPLKGEQTKAEGL